jgi:hypothetical protein
MDGAMNEGLSPVPLPLGEGTLLHPLSAIQASLLPGGEGQDEGSERGSLRLRGDDGRHVPGRLPLLPASIPSKADQR